MSSDGRLLLLALGAVVVLIVLIARFKLHPLIALTTVSLAMGAAAGMAPNDIVRAFQDGVGASLGFIAIVVGIGTMLGKVMAESGAATRIATTLTAWFGEQRVHWALMVVAFILGIPVFFQVGFVLLIPLVFTIGRRTGLSLIKLGIPLVAGLSVVHGMLPPHPAAMLAVGTFKADVGRTILYGLIVGLPTAAVAGPIFGAWVARRVLLPAENPLAVQLSTSDVALASVPGFVVSLFTVLVPVLLMLLSTAADSVGVIGVPRDVLHFIGNPIVALLLALLLSFYTLLRGRGFSREQVLKFCNDCLAPTATILLVIGAGAGFNQVLVASGVGRAVARMATESHASPIVLAWIVAALIRVATGSATVAMTTAAGIVAPLAASLGASPEILVLAAGAGSLVLSHVNDAGFWLIKEFFNMTVPDTLKTWTVAETIIGLAGLAFTLILAMVLGV
jgi:GntP family gluconate:H+ symporter